MKQPHNLSPFLYGFVAILIIFTACKKEYSAEDIPIPPVVKDYNILLKFRAVINDTVPLVFGDTYTNHFNESFTVSAFKFYVHGIEMNSDSGRVFRTTPDKYFLVDFADSNTTNIKLTVLPYLYNRISFVIGVDSARNVSGAQTGALDPAKGMFWTWNTGYIMAKLEGNAIGRGAFEYHIGGFQEPDNVLKKPTLLFPFGETVDLKPEKSTDIIITANISSWFYNPHDLRFRDNLICTTPGPLARQISENYSKMFTVVSVINE